MNRFAARKVLGTLSVVWLMSGAVGCQSDQRSVGPIRAMWVTRYDYKTPADVVRIMANCDEAGINTVLFQARGNGTVFYRSKIEPWAEQFGFKYPGFDPLGLAVKEAHRRGMELHAWVNVMPAWQGPGKPAIRKQLYHTHPEWFWYDIRGRRQPIHHRVGGKSRDWYVSVNPCLPEVRAYLVKVFRELVTRYDVDGLHMDYIRFPNEPVVPGEKIPDYPRDKRTLALFHQATGQTPESNRGLWNRWRTDQVSRLAADVKAMMGRVRPDAVLSAAVGSVPKRALTHFQDGRKWLQAGTVDVVYLMNYTPDVSAFGERIGPWLNVNSQARVVPGLMVRAQAGAKKDAGRARRQVEIARASTGNFCIFAYSTLFDSASTSGEKPDSPARRLRAQRRDFLVPFLRSLADKLQVADAGAGEAGRPRYLACR